MTGRGQPAGRTGWLTEGVDTPHFTAAVTAFTAAFSDHLIGDVASFPDLFSDTATIDVPFDGDGDGTPIVGRAAIAEMSRSLAGFLWFDEVSFQSVRATADPAVVVCEYQAVLRRADMPGRRRRRYIAVVTFSAGRISELREYGGPFLRTQ